MRPSLLQHPLAVLRDIIGVTQPELARLVNRSVRTIQSIEVAQHAMGVELASVVEELTGVDAAWLRQGNPKAPIRKSPRFLEPGEDPAYDRAFYERHRARREQEQEQAASPSGKPDPETQRSYDERLQEKLRFVLERSAGTEQANLVRWRLRETLEKLALDLGFYEDRVLFMLLASKYKRQFAYAAPEGYTTYIFRNRAGANVVGPHRFSLMIFPGEITDRALAAKAQEPDSTVLPEILSEPAAAEEGWTVTKAWHRDERAAAGLECWSMELRHTRTGKINMHTWFRHGVHLLQFSLNSQDSPDVRAGYDFIVRSVRPITESAG